MLTREQWQASLPQQGLFREETPWLIAPEPLELSKKHLRILDSLGHILAQFYDASHRIYLRAAQGKEHSWLAALLDAGKPDWLIAAQRSPHLRQAAPRVIRPDLLLTEDGFSLVELDSVPGGQGITYHLAQVYSKLGYPILGGSDGILQGFKVAHPQGAHIIVSEESADYASEMKYLASALGEGYSFGKAEELNLTTNEQSSIYRFFELFDTNNIPPAQKLIQAAAEARLQLSPPPLPHLEEKLWLALLHCPALQDTWKQELRAKHLERLQSIVPYSWVVDPCPLPPHAALPHLNLHSWQQVGKLSQSERQLVLKISGFHPSAWGSRGVHIGHDLPATEWAAAITHALEQHQSHPWILQRFSPGCTLTHPYLAPQSDEHKTLLGRARICPYYYRSPDGQTQLGGALATIAPADKKKIHGMKDAILTSVQG